MLMCPSRTFHLYGDVSGTQMLVVSRADHFNETFCPVDVDTNFTVAAARGDLSLVVVAFLFIRALNDKYQLSAVVVAVGCPMTEHP